MGNDRHARMSGRGTTVPREKQFLALAFVVNQRREPTSAIGAVRADSEHW